MLPIHVLPVFASDMALRETGDPNGKIVHPPNKFDELVGKFKAAGRGLKLAASGRIAA